jgi:septum formation protein
MKKIILASQSPRRRQLLEWAEIDFDVVISDADESFPSALEHGETAVHIARKKALMVKERNPDQIILAADTIVVLDEEILGKPANKEEAIQILQKLSGKKHVVITGVVILNQEQEIAFSDSTEVYFHELTLQQISFYVDKYQPFDKAGAYAIQEWIGVVGIKSVNGDFYNVMGLPVSRVVKELQRLKV